MDDPPVEVAGHRPDSGPIDAVPGRTRRVAIVALLIGGALLAVTINAPDGSSVFFLSGFALAAVWLGAASIAPRHGRAGFRTVDLALGGGAGVVAFVGFLAVFAVVRHVDALEGPVGALLDTADESGRGAVLALALVNAVAEELFFRGTLVDAVRGSMRRVAGVVPYVVATIPSANLALVLAAAVMGAVLTELRISTRSVTAPLACHVAWSLLMLTLFPRP